MSDIRLYVPDVSPIQEMIRRLLDKREGPAGPASFVCWNAQTVRFDWLEADEWCWFCGTYCGTARNPRQHDCPRKR